MRKMRRFISFSLSILLILSMTLGDVNFVTATSSSGSSTTSGDAQGTDEDTPDVAKPSSVTAPRSLATTPPPQTYTFSISHGDIEMEVGDIIAFNEANTLSDFTISGLPVGVNPTISLTSSDSGKVYTHAYTSGPKHYDDLQAIKAGEVTITINATATSGGNTYNATGSFKVRVLYEHIDIRLENATITTGTITYLDGVEVSNTTQTYTASISSVTDAFVYYSDGTSERVTGFGKRVGQGAIEEFSSRGLGLQLDITHIVVNMSIKVNGTIYHNIPVDFDNAAVLQAIIDCEEFTGLDFDVNINSINIISQFTKTLTYVSNNGTNATTIERTITGTSLTVKSPADLAYTYPGHSFTGWLLDGSSSVLQPGATLTMDQNKTLIAQWSANNQIVTFLNEDYSLISNTNVPYGGSTTAPADPVKAEDADFTYEFAGWIPQGPYTIADISNVMQDMTFVASFEPIAKAVISYYVDGALYNQEKVPRGADVTLTNFNEILDPGRYFVGWFENSDGTGDISGIQNIQTDISVYGFIMTEIFEVTFFEEDGMTLIQSTIVPYGAQVFQPLEPVKAPDADFTYEFAGWIPQGGYSILDIDSVIQGMSFVASFESIAKPTVTYMVDGMVYDSLKVARGSNLLLSPFDTSVLPIGTFFEGWFSDEEGFNPVFFLDNITEDIIVYGYTDLYEYEVTFLDEDFSVLQYDEVDFGSNVLAPMDPMKLADADFTYEFAGWIPQGGYTLLNLDFVMQDMTFIANYTAIEKPTVTYMVDGNYYDSVKVEKGAGLTLVPFDESLLLPGMYFTGWFSDMEGSQSISQLINITEDTTVYGYTHIYQYDVQFLNEDLSTLQSDTVNFGSSVSAPAIPTKAEDADFTYEFAGWVPQGEYTIGDILNVMQDMTFVAQFNAIEKPIVTYMVDGMVYDSLKVARGSNLLLTPFDTSVLPMGTFFEGWFLDVERLNPVFYLDNITEDTIVYGYTDLYEYEVTFLDEDFSVLQYDEVDFGSNVLAPMDPMKLADADFTYEFAGWIPQGEYILSDIGFVTQEMTFIANYTAIEKPTVTYLVDGIFYDSVKVEKGAGLTLVPFDESLLLPGTYFTGWFSDMEGSQSISQLINITEDTIVYGYTHIYQYDVQFLNEDLSTLQSDTVNFGSSVSAPAIPTKAEDADFTYEFAGWVPQGQYTIGDILNVMQDMTFVAQFNAIEKPTVTYMVDGMLYDSLKIAKGSNLTLVPYDESLLSAGMYFTGWFSDMEESTVVDQLFEVMEDTTVYGSTHFYQYGVSFLNEDLSTIQSDTVFYGSSVTAPAAPTKAEDADNTYEFAGWVPQGEYSLSNIENVTQNMTFIASFTAIPKHIVNYYVDGVLLNTVKVADGSNLTLDPYDSSGLPLGNYFEGWFADAVGTISVGTLENITTDIDVYGFILTQQFTIRFFDEDGTTLLNTMVVDYGTALDLPEEPTKDPTTDGSLTYYWSFKGWNPGISELQYTIDDLNNIIQNMDFIASYSAVGSDIYEAYSVTYYKDSIADDNILGVERTVIAKADITATGILANMTIELDKYQPNGYGAGAFSIGDVSDSELEAYLAANGNVDVVYTEDVYTVTYMIGAKAVTVDGNPDTYRFSDGTITLKNYVVTDLTFSGWFTDADKTNKTTTLTSDMFLESAAGTSTFVRDTEGNITGIILYGSVVASYVDTNDKTTDTVKTVVNKITAAVKTGDAGTIAIWAGIFTISFAAAVVVTVKGFRRRKF